MAKSVISTSIANFDVKDNGNNGTTLFYGGKKVIEFAQVSWWNVDSILNAVECNKEKIQARLKEIVSGQGGQNVVEQITKENAVEVLTRLTEVFGNEDKGFYASRLKQCLNRLNAPQGTNKLYA